MWRICENDFREALDIDENELASLFRGSYRSGLEWMVSRYLFPDVIHLNVPNVRVSLCII